MFITVALILYLPLKNVEYIYIIKYIWILPKKIFIILYKGIDYFILRDFETLPLTHIQHGSDTQKIIFCGK